MNRKDVDTGREYALPRGALLLSTTDSERRIAYCNQALIEASGYTRDELIGQSVFLLDHPDMPPEVLSDLWATLDAGMPWSGIVKSRRKNGDHFWVRTTIAPVLEGRYRVGCTIVRTAALRAQVEAADALYAAMHQKAAPRSGAVEAAADRWCTGLGVQSWPAE